MGSKVAPREPEGSPKSPKGAPKPPPGRLKTIKKSTWDPTWAPKGVWEAPGVPPGGTRAKNQLKNVTFSQIPGLAARRPKAAKRNPQEP